MDSGHATYGPVRGLLALLFGAGVVFVVYFFYVRFEDPLSPQSAANLAFAAEDSLSAAFWGYPLSWPPVYPSVLWAVARLGVDVRLFNLLCFYGVLGLLGALGRRYVQGVHPAPLVLLVAFTHAHYVVMYQQVSETFFVLLSLVAFGLLLKHRSAPKRRTALALGGVSVLLCLTRFFGLFWIVPLAAGTLWASGRRVSRRQGWLQAGSYLAVVGAGVGPYLLALRLGTGSFTGMDRFGERDFPEQFAHWSELTGFETNVRFLLKTTFVDAFSPVHYAGHEVVTAQTLTPLEWGASGLGALLLLLIGGIVARRYRRLFAAGRLRAPHVFLSPAGLAVCSAGVYVAAVLALWTISNNDPLYSRFMLPAYPFFAFAGFTLHAWVRRHSASWWERLPFWLLYALVLTANVRKLLLEVWRNADGGAS